LEISENLLDKRGERHMKIPYFPGCTMKTTAKNFEMSAIASAKKIGIELVEIPRWNCCGVVSSLTSDDLMKHLAPVRNFLRAQKMNKENAVDENRLVTLCSMCYNTLSLTNNRMKENVDELQKINDFMHREDENYAGSVDIVHFLSILDEWGFDKLKIENPLKNLKVASYYGCMLLRPKEVGIDNPEAPQIMEKLVTTIGAESVEWNAKSRCCGSYHTVKNVDLVKNLVSGIINDARENGAEAIITSCPLCAFNLDVRQKEMAVENVDFQAMPIFYFTQLLGIALGLEKGDLGLEFNAINPNEILKKYEKIKGAK